MKIAVLGTSMVGQALSGKLAELGHAVVVGTRDVAKTMANTEAHPYGFPAFSIWLKDYPQIQVASFAEAARHGEWVINATNGNSSLAALQRAGAANLNGKILMDIANPLDFSQGNPPTLAVCNSDSLGEQIQHAFPQVKVVKTLDTLTASLMVNPRAVADGEHTIFVSGNDTEAKAEVAKRLMEWFGWKHILDLGDISTARGTEMYLPLWLRMWGALGTGMFNIQIVK